MVFPFKVSEVVLMGRHPYLSALAFEGDEDIEIARSAMERTQTIQFAQRNFNEISGGEKQRVVIAGAIAQEPELMILDEPTSALDIKYQIQILNILKQLNEDKNMTVILAMHDLHLASKFCKRLVLLEDGKIFQDGKSEEVLEKKHIYNLKFLYNCILFLYQSMISGRSFIKLFLGFQFELNSIPLLTISPEVFDTPHPPYGCVPSVLLCHPSIASSYAI